jgi:hypothetical protein
MRRAGAFDRLWRSGGVGRRRGAVRRDARQVLATVLKSHFGSGFGLGQVYDLSVGVLPGSENQVFEAGSHAPPKFTLRNWVMFGARSSKRMRRRRCAGRRRSNELGSRPGSLAP